MATNENLIPIPGRLHSVATEGHVAGADEIFDDSLNKDQATINQEVNEAIGTGGSVDSRISAAINALDSSKSQSAGTDGLALNIVEENGKITSISGSIASNTYDAYGAASAAQSAAISAAATDATTKVNAAKSEIKGNATSACDTLGEAEARINANTSAISAETTRAQAKEAQLQTYIEALSKSQPKPKTAEEWAAMTSWEEGVIYRVQGTTSYADWMYNGTTTIKMAEYNNAIDDEPTAGSNNLVKSGGVYPIKKEVLGETRTYTRRADGVFIPLSPNILKGDIITTIEGENLRDCSFKDENGQAISISISSLPITADRKYVSWGCYLDTNPEVVMTVKQAGLIEKYEQEEIKVDNIEKNVYGEERNFNFTANGVTQYSPLKKGDIILSAKNGDTSVPITLKEAESSAGVTEVSSFPFICDKDYAAIRIYIASEPTIKILYAVNGLHEDVKKNTNAINNTGITYTRIADGGHDALNPPIKAGDVITTAVGSGITSFVLYDENNNATHVDVNALPFNAEKKYIKWAAYNSEGPNFTITVNSIGLKGKTEELDEKVAQLEQEIDDIIESGIISFPTTFIPKTIYGVIGDTLQIFNRGIVRSIDPYKFYNKFTCSQGKVFSRYLEITPTLINGSIPTNLTIKHQLIGDSWNTSEEKTANFKIAARPTESPSNNINVLCVGDSTTAGGEWTSELKRRLTGTLNSGTPAADGLSNITFVGRVGTSTHFEATGGWTWPDFYTPRDALRFNVIGISSVNIGSVYQFTDGNGHIIRLLVAEVNVTDSSGNIRFIYNYDSEGHGVPSSQSGTLTKYDGSGDNTITFTGYSQETYCPFYDENLQGAGFTNYANTYCDGRIDAVLFNLSNLNAGIVGTGSLETLIEQMKTLLDALHRDFPNCKVLLATPYGINQYHGIEYNFGAFSGFNQWSLLYALFRYAQAIQDFVNQNDYKEWCFITNLLGEVDSENAFPIAEKNVNTRMTKKEIIGTNGAHPTNDGYMMIADSFYRCFVNTILN